MCLFCERRDDNDTEKDKPLSYSEALERAYEFNFRFNNNIVIEDVKTIEESLVALPPANQSNKLPRSPRKRINKKKRFPSIIKNVSSLEEIKEDELFVSESSETSSEEEKENDKRDLAAIHRERALNSGAFIPDMNEGRSRHHHHHRKDRKHSRKKEKG